MFSCCCSLCVLFPHWCLSIYSVFSFLNLNIFLAVVQSRCISINILLLRQRLVNSVWMHEILSTKKKSKRRYCACCVTQIWFTFYSLTKHALCVIYWSPHYLIAFVLEVLSSHFSLKNKHSDVHIAASSDSCIRLLFTPYSLHSHNEDNLCYRMTWHRKERRDRITIQMLLIDFHNT
jgi:hypothetical protein